MKILFVSRHCGYFRYYDSVLRELASRGHHVHLAVEKRESLGNEAVIQKLVRDEANITYDQLQSAAEAANIDPETAADNLHDLAKKIRDNSVSV